MRNAKIFWQGGCDPSHTLLSAYGARALVPFSDGLDTRPCNILDPPLILALDLENVVKIRSYVS